MSEYKASNGAKVFKLEDDSISVYGNPGGSPSHGNNLWPGNDVALAEYFQAERDKALGLWRWPENPDYVVKSSSRYSLAVIHEPTFWSRNVVHFADTRDVAEFMHEEPGKHLKPWRKAARAYLKEQYTAHPDPAENPLIVVHEAVDLADAEKNTGMHWDGELYVNDEIDLAFHADQIFRWSSGKVVAANE